VTSLAVASHEEIGFAMKTSFMKRMRLVSVAAAAVSLALMATPASAGRRSYPRPPVATATPRTAPCVMPDYTGKLYFQVQWDQVNCNMNFADVPLANPVSGKIVSVGGSSSGPFYAPGAQLPNGTIVWVNYESNQGCTKCHW
jgi:hypothetical protein